MAILKDLLVHSTARALGSVYGASFIKDGGTSSQFLKADGSVDSNVYITSAALPTVNNAVLTVSGSGLTISTASTFSANASANQTITITHPTQTSYSSGLYKITTNGTGHVTGATAVTTSDITGLSGWPSYALTSQIPDVSDFVTKSTYQVITASKRFTKDIELYADSGNTPSLIFQRGSSSTYYDWKMYNDGSGVFRIQCNKNTSFANQISINADDSFSTILPIVTTSSINATGIVTASAFVKTSATATNVLQAGGGDIALATVATTGSYSDLSGLPTITDEKVKRTLTTGSDEYPVIFSSTTATTTSPTETARYSASLKANGNGDVVFTKSSTKCRLQYDNTNLCLNFMFE